MGGDAADVYGDVAPAADGCAQARPATPREASPRAGQGRTRRTATGGNPGQRGSAEAGPETTTAGSSPGGESHQPATTLAVRRAMPDVSISPHTETAGSPRQGELPAASCRRPPGLRPAGAPAAPRVAHQVPQRDDRRRGDQPHHSHDQSARSVIPRRPQQLRHRQVKRSQAMIRTRHRAKLRHPRFPPRRSARRHDRSIRAVRTGRRRLRDRREVAEPQRHPRARTVDHQRIREHRHWQRRHPRRHLRRRRTTARRQHMPAVLTPRHRHPPLTSPAHHATAAPALISESTNASPTGVPVSIPSRATSSRTPAARSNRNT